VRVWRLDNGQLATTLSAEFGSCAAWSPDGALLAVCGNDASVSVYDAYDWRLRQRASSSARRITSVSFSADGKLLAGCGADAVVRLWEVSVSPRKVDAAAPGSNLAEASSPPASPAPPATPTAPVVERVQLLASLRLHTSVDPAAPAVLSSALSPDGLWLATGGADRVVQLLDVAKGGLAPAFKHAAPVTAVAVDAQRGLVASADDQGNVRISKLPDLEKGREFGFDAPVERMIFAPGGDLILGGHNGTIEQWSVQNPAKLVDFQGHTGAVSGLAIARDGQTLISSGRDGRLLAQSLSNRAAPPAVLRTMPFPIDELALSPAGNAAAMIVSRSGQVIIYEMATRRSFNIQAAGGQITAAAFLPDGGTTLLGASSGEIYAFNPQQGQRSLAKAHPGTAVHRLLLSGDGSRLASISTTGEVKVWELLARE
jgi:WD40 repeat protein